MGRNDFKYVKGVRVNRMSEVTKIKPHVKDPIRYPKVQCGYENLSQVMFAVQMDNLMQDLTKEMLKEE